jgi:DNA-binding FadR family transcriptional regulator
MERLNLTLDPGTSGALARHAQKAGKPRATLARELIREAITRRDALDRQRKLARDYAAGRGDAREVLAELEAAQLDLLGDDEG